MRLAQCMLIADNHFSSLLSLSLPLLPAKDLSGSCFPPSRKRQLGVAHTPTMPTGEWCVGESRDPPPTGGKTL